MRATDPRGRCCRSGSTQLRRQTAEHPFGTIKAWMGAPHFLSRRLPRVSAEMGLHVLAYNLKRVIKILGTAPLLQALRA
jgi:transposase